VNDPQRHFATIDYRIAKVPPYSILKALCHAAWQSFDCARKDIGGRGGGGLDCTNSLRPFQPYGVHTPETSHADASTLLYGRGRPVRNLHAGTCLPQRPDLLVGWCYEADENPVAYGLTFALNIFVVIFLCGRSGRISACRSLRLPRSRLDQFLLPRMWPRVGPRCLVRHRALFLLQRFRM
jgi:hypothetical protein